MKTKISTVSKTLLFILVVLLAMTPTSYVPNVLATLTWTDSINIYPHITTEYTNIRILTNNYTFAIDVRIYVHDTDRTDLLEHYKLSANETDFITISSGNITQSENTYYKLNPGQKLVFTVKAKPTPSIGVGETATIVLKVELLKHAVGAHDIAVIDVAYKTLYSLNTTYPGCPVNINVTAKNQGNFIENFTVTAYYQNVTADYPIGMLNITNLGPGENKTLTFIWDTTNVKPCQYYTIKANTTIVPEDVNATNNAFIDGELKIKMVGDVDGNQRVNFVDLFALAAAYGSRPEDSNWNPDCDFDCDGRVSFTDLFALAANYGKECP